MGTKHSLKPIEAFSRDTLDFPGPTAHARSHPQPTTNSELSSEHPSFPSLPQINRWVITDDGGETLRIDFEDPVPQRRPILERRPSTIERRPPSIERTPLFKQTPSTIPPHLTHTTSTSTNPASTQPPESSEKDISTYPTYAHGDIRSKKQARKIIDEGDYAREPCNHCRHLGLECWRHYQYRVCAFCRSNNWGREECYVGGGGDEETGVEEEESAEKGNVEKEERGRGQRYWWT